MKKIILILAFVLIGVPGFAQTKSYNPIGTQDPVVNVCGADESDIATCTPSTGSVDTTTNQNITGRKNFSDFGLEYGTNRTTLEANCVAPSGGYAQMFLYQHPTRGDIPYVCTGSGTSAPLGGGKTFSRAGYAADVTASTDNIAMGSAPFATTVDYVYCRYSGCTITTAPTITVQDAAANAMTLGATLTCVSSTAAIDCTTDTGCVDVTAGGSLNQFEQMQFNISNTPAPSGECEVELGTIETLQ